MLSSATIFYDLVLFGAICSFFVPFAPVSCCFLRCVADCAFCYLSSPKMVPKCSPEASKYLQNPQNRSKIAPWSILGPPSGTKILFFRLGIDFGAQFGAPWGPKSTKKSIFCEKNAPRSPLTKQWLPGALHHLIFHTFFGHFWPKIDEKNITLLCFLLVCPTLEKPCILQATLLENSVFANMLKYWKSDKK